MNKYIRSPEITFEVIDNHLLLLNPKAAKAFECNEIITSLWEIVSKEVSKDEIIEVLLHEFEVGEDELRVDIENTLLDMVSKGLLLIK